jgi:GH15 family glucan-1,4-alpha-glucosidase
MRRGRRRRATVEGTAATCLTRRPVEAWRLDEKESAMTETAIADHGMIGDLQTAALVTTDGSIDWFCLPRFDSPSVFGALLDDTKGGHFRVHPTGIEYTSTQVYFPDTAVLVTRFFTESGVGQVVDFMPPAGATATDTHRLVRMLQCVRGEISFEVDVAPRFDYGRLRHRTELTDTGAAFMANGTARSPCTSSGSPTTSTRPRLNSGATTCRRRSR